MTILILFLATCAGVPLTLAGVLALLGAMAFDAIAVNLALDA
jgi:hypothetical protein